MPMKNQLDKIIYFVRNTGDKVIVLKDDTEFVIMPLDDYEGLFRHKKQLAGLTEEEMLSRVNREIALWRESQKTLADLAEDDYEPKPRFRDDDFYYRGLDDVDEDDKWIEPNWQDDEDEKIEDFHPEENFDLPDFDLPQDLTAEPADEDEDFESKRGFDDVVLPWDERLDIKPDVLDTPPPSFSRSESRSQKRFNNFGYPNPTDTVEDELGESMADFERDANYDHITPPPSR